MENILTELQAANLDLRLTDEKLYIKTSTSSETFALRSINGIGIVDLVDKYNSELSDYRKAMTNNIARIVLGLFLLIIGFLANYGLGIIFIVPGLILLIIGLVLISRLSKPTLLSSVRIMMIGGSRDFEFDKASYGSGKIAEFVASVESTLSAYHQK